MPVQQGRDINIFGRVNPTLDFTGARRGGSSFVDPITLPTGFQSLGTTDPAGGIDMSKFGGFASLLGGAGAAFGAFNAITPDFDPSLTSGKARELIAGQGRVGAQKIQRGVSQGIQDTASQFAARGLGSSGSVTGDIAGMRGAGVQAQSQLSADLDAQLLQLLQYIDQRDAQFARQEAQGKSQFLGDLADLGLTVGGLALAPATGGA